MAKVIIGELQQQKEGFKAFIPTPFPPKGGFSFSHTIERKNDTAARLLGKLDGITQLLPDMDFFLFIVLLCKNFFFLFVFSLPISWSTENLFS